jgi:MATE family multidrug resistance protein
MAQPESTHRQVWAMAGPIILANVTVPLLGAVDTAVVGHLPQPYYLGGVAIGGMLFNYLYHLFNCLRMGTTGPTAQARGAGDDAEVRAILVRALVLASLLGAGLLVLQLPIIAIALWLIDGSVAVEHYAREYFLIRVWALPAVLATYAMIGWFYGLRDVRSPLAVQLFTNVLNIVLDLLFVFGFGWGVAGVAWASVISEYAGVVLALVCVRRQLARLPNPGSRARILDRAKLVRMLAINRDIVLRTLCVVSVLAFFMAKSAELGDLALAANQVLHIFLVVTSFGLDGIAHAAETILGEAVGRRDRNAFEHARRIVFFWAGLVGAVAVALYGFAGPAMIALLTDIAEVRALAGEYLVWPVLMPIVSVWAYTYDGIYLAATRTRAMRNSVIASFAVFLLLLYSLLPLLGNHGLWLAVAGFLGGRGLLLHLAYPALARELR